MQKHSGIASLRQHTGFYQRGQRHCAFGPCFMNSNDRATFFCRRKNVSAHGKSLPRDQYPNDTDLDECMKLCANCYANMLALVIIFS